MVMTKEMVPEVRFEGFEGQWETLKLEDLFLFSKGKGIPKRELCEKGTECVLYGQLYTTYNEEIKKVKYKTGLNKNELTFGKKYDILIPSSGETALEISKASALLVDNVALGGDINILRPMSDTVKSSFMSYQINSVRKNALAELAEGHTVIHIYNNELKGVNVTITEGNEQEKIGQYFSNLNGVVEFKQVEIDKLKNFKQAMLQKMFPKEEETVPEVRFEGVSGEWEKLRIGDLGLIITGNTPSTTDTSNYDIDGTLWITPTDIKGTVTTQSAKKLSDKGVSKARIVPKGSILVTSIASIGKNTLIKESSGFNQQINAVVPNEAFNSYFLLTLSELWSNEMKRTAPSGTMQIVNRTQFSLINTIVPSYNEQVRIGSFFKELDSKIKLEEQNLQKLNQFKKAMLQKMFV